MNPSKRENLIQELAGNLKPVGLSPKPLKTALALSLGAVVFAFAVLLLFFGHRNEMPNAFDSTVFWTNEVGSVLGVMMLAYCLSLMSLPGRDTRFATTIALSLIAFTPLALLTLGIKNGSFETSASANELACSWRLLLVSMPAAVLAVYVAKRGAPPRPFSFALFSALLAIGVGSLVLPFVCVNSSVTHMILFHLLVPLSLAIPLSAIFVWRQIRW